MRNLLLGLSFLRLCGDFNLSAVDGFIENDLFLHSKTTEQLEEIVNARSDRYPISTSHLNTINSLKAELAKYESNCSKLSKTYHKKFTDLGNLAGDWGKCLNKSKVLLDTSLSGEYLKNESNKLLLELDILLKTIVEVAGFAKQGKTSLLALLCLRTSK